MEFLHFQNTIYFIIFAVVSGIMLLLPNLRKGSGSQTLSAKQAVELSNSASAQFIDIRPFEDFSKATIPQAKSFPSAELEEKLKNLPKKPLILFADSGRTAQQAAQTLKKHEVENVYWLKNGINDWITEGFPVKPGNKTNKKKA